jgi:hypothetical protein
MVEGSKHQARQRSVFEVSWGGFLSRMRAVSEQQSPLPEKVRGIARVAFEAYRHDPRGVKVVILEVARSLAGARVDRNSARGLPGEDYRRAWAVSAPSLSLSHASR